MIVDHTLVALASIAFVSVGQGCPSGWVCVPRTVVNQMSCQDQQAAKQLAANFGVKWKITENAGQQRRSVRPCEQASR